VDFPSFGDAQAYDQLGASCAAALTAGHGAFDACYHPVRTPGAILLFAVPHLVASDRVDAAYVMLLMNLVFLAASVVALAATLIGDRELLPGATRRAQVLAVIAFACLLPNLVAHVPVTLADLPGLALVLVAVAVAAGIVAAPGAARARRYALCGALVAAATLVKLNFFPLGFVLLAGLLVLDRGRRHPGDRARAAALFALGMSPVALQFASVYLHTGRLALYDDSYIRTYFSHVDKPPNVEAVIATIPVPNAYMVQVTPAVSLPSFHALKLFRGLFGFEWAVYLGEPSRGPRWEVGASDLVLAWALVTLYAAIAAWILARGPSSLRLLWASAVVVAALNTWLGHTELRYYDLCRVVLWVTVATALWGAGLRRSGLVKTEGRG
jgi:hypothetical protein